MSRRRATVSQAAVRRAVRGVESAGKVASAVRINLHTGEIEIVFGKPEEQKSDQSVLDAWITKHANAS
jgi:hypothetical protein